MEQVKLQEVIEKAKKLSALAERGGTKEEAMVAASKLQELLTKYNLTISSLEENEKPEFGRTDFTLDCNSVQRKWRGALYLAISRANDCEAITIRSNGKEAIAIIGRKHNTEIVNYLYTYLSETIQKLACDYVKVMAGIAKQGGGSINANGACMYRSQNNRKCHIGLLITDEEYSEEIEHDPIDGGRSIARQALEASLGVEFTEEDNPILAEIQEIHDSCAMSWAFDWKHYHKRMTEFARDHELNIQALNQHIKGKLITVEEA